MAPFGFMALLIGAAALVIMMLLVAYDLIPRASAIGVAMFASILGMIGTIGALGFLITSLPMGPWTQQSLIVIVLVGSWFFYFAAGYLEISQRRRNRRGKS